MFLSKLFKKDDNEIQDINGIKLTKKQIEDLEWYKVNYNVKNYKKILGNINNEQFEHVDNNGLPSDEHYYLLQDLYDEIEKQNE